MRFMLDVERTSGKRRMERDLWNEAEGAWAKAQSGDTAAAAWLGATLKALSIVTGVSVTEVHAEWEERRHGRPSEAPQRPAAAADPIAAAVAARPPDQRRSERFPGWREGETSIMGEPRDGSPIPAPGE